MKKALTITVIFLLIAVLSFGLIACKKNTASSDPIPEASELRVTFDESATYTLDDLTDGSDALSVEVVTGKETKKVTFHVESSKVTEDGKYIEVVISAEGFTKTVRLPYAGEEQSAIRAELRPLYEMLSAEGKKCFAFTLDGESVEKTGAEAETFAWRVVLNLLPTDVQLALLSGAQGEDGTMAYDNTVLSFDGIQPDDGKYQEMLDLLLGILDVDLDLGSLFGSDDAEGTASAGEQEDVTVGEEQSMLESFFVDLSSLLETLDDLSGKPAVALAGVEISHTGGTYLVKGDAKRLINVLKAIVDEDALDGIDLDMIVDFLDEQSDGALKAGKLSLEVSFGIEETTASFSFRFDNRKTGAKGRISFSAELSATPFVIPASQEEDSAGSDLEITIPIALPQRDMSLTLTAVVHLSNILSEGKGELLTATLDYNDTENAATFVLRDTDVYLDLGGFVELFNLGDNVPATFAYAFEKDGEPATIWEILPDLFLNESSDTEEPEYEEDEEEPDDPLFANGYGVTIADDGELKFHVGVTEDDVRDKLNVCTFDDEDNQIPFADYTLEIFTSADEEDKITFADYLENGFKGSASFSGTIKIVLDDKHDWDLPLVIFDPENAQPKSLILPTKARFAKGTSVSDAGAAFLFSVKWSDGSVSWVEEAEGLTFTQIMSSFFLPVSTDADLSEAGDYYYTAEYKFAEDKAPLSGGGGFYVFDPENLIVERIEGPNEVMLLPEATIDDLRDQLFLTAYFDDGSAEEVIDECEIEGFDESATSVTLIYEGKRWIVTLVRPGSSDPEEKEVSITDYIRFLEDLKEGDDPVEAAIAILKENKDLWDAVFSVIKGDMKTTLHVNINTEDDKDLFALLNLFFGIPSESGWIDLDENNLPDVIADLRGKDGFDLNGMFDLIAGTSVPEMFSDLTLDVTFSWDDGIGLMISLADSEQKGYLQIGITTKSIETVAPVERTQEELESASDFEELGTVLFLLLSNLVA